MMKNNAGKRSYIAVNRSIVLVFSAFAASACIADSASSNYVALDQINIAQHFTTTEINADTIVSQITKCIPGYVSNQYTLPGLIKGLDNPVAVSIMKQGGSASQFISRGTSSTCLSFSTAKYPIFPADVLDGTANPIGVAPDVLEGWNSQIARLLATQGHAKIAYVLADGTAYITNYSVIQNDAILHYPSSLKQVGEWESDQYDEKFRGGITSFATSKFPQKIPFAHAPAPSSS